MRLKDKVAIICGSSGRIGWAVSLLFAQEGARLALVTRRPDAVSELVSSIPDGRAIVAQGDPTDGQEASRIVAEVVEAYGRIDILYYGVGIFDSGDVLIEDTAESQWDETLRINLRGAYLMSRYVVPRLIEATGGSIIFVSASLGARLAGNVAYAASKDALIGMARRMAKEHRKDNIRVNVLLPYQVRERSDANSIAPVSDPITARCRPEDIAYGALYLASQESRAVTGVALPIDGGVGL
ncbi:MAG: oxidoreductase [Dehalococcoidia bacterium]|nr:oxidoreductase [Dehalococcoidia bacterium]